MSAGEEQVSPAQIPDEFVDAAVAFLRGLEVSDDSHA